ncbi:MAG: hypothetical protein AAF483_03510 [Planctomycetota bacterium]
MPTTTSLNVPPLRSTEGNPGIIPTPAYTSPALPPPCLDASNGGVCNLFGRDKHLFQCKLKAKGKAGELQMTPMRVVAPVGGEVVLLAGICGREGRFVKREPLEWMLSPDSVGTFIAVGDDKPGKLSSFLLHDPKIEKLDVDFARGRTSSKRTLITRGSPTPQDDIQLGSGQTWLSISSPSEGVSRITALAPDSEIWDRRHQTAKIYWVDAQWEFPAPVILDTGASTELVTRVTKSENLVPAEGWIVEYTILEPSIAVFASNPQSNKARVRVDANGQARIAIRSAPQGRGTTPIIVDVIRPADPDDSMPQLVIGRGQTTATFSSAGLALEAFGPKTGIVGGQLTYSAVLGNPGDIGAENVKLQMRLPAGTKLVSATPQPSRTLPEFLEWDQGVLPANQQLEVAVVLEPERTNTISVLVQAAGEGIAVQERRVTTEIVQPQIDVTFTPVRNVAEAEVGQIIEYQIVLTNTGRETLTNLQLDIQSAAGLPEYYKGKNKVQQTIGVLRPGEKVQVPVTFNVQQSGQLEANLTVSVGGRAIAQKSTSIRGLQPPPKKPDVGVSLELPERIQAGNQVDATITVRNPGEVRLTGLQLELQIDPTLNPIGVSVPEGAATLSEDRRKLILAIEDILPPSGVGGVPIRQYIVRFESRAVTNQGQLAVRVTSAQGESGTDSRTFQALASSVPAPVLPSDGNQPPSLPPDTGNAPGTGNPGAPSNPGTGNPPVRSNQLILSLEDFNDPTIVGQEIRYTLAIKNDRATADRNINVRLKLPQGVQFKSMTLGGTNVNVQFQAGSVIIPIIRTLRADERVSYIFVVVPQIPQLMEIEAQVFSDAQPQAQTIKQPTTVIVR